MDKSNRLRAAAVVVAALAGGSVPLICGAVDAAPAGGIQIAEMTLPRPAAHRSAERGDAMILRCESFEGRPQHCPADLRGRIDVGISRQLSESRCVEGSSWGWDRDGVWVDRGCRADFQVVHRGRGRGDRDFIVCESHEGHWNHCPIRLGRRADVDLSRQLSRSPCREGDSWGWDRDGIWVDDGCRAEFSVARYQGRRWEDR